jgi:hypothetical protein
MSNMTHTGCRDSCSHIFRGNYSTERRRKICLFYNQFAPHARLYCVPSTIPGVKSTKTNVVPADLGADVWADTTLWRRQSSPRINHHVVTLEIEDLIHPFIRTLIFWANYNGKWILFHFYCSAFIVVIL